MIPRDGSRPSRRGGWVLAAALLALLGVALNMPPVRQQELRVLVSGRNMAVSGDWMVPVFQGQPRLRKPPLAYWMAAVPMRVSGETRSAPVARIPFVLASLGLAALLGAWGRRMGDDATGLLALALPLAAVGWWRYGPLAETDMVLALCSALAAWCLWRVLCEGGSWALWLGAGAATGLAILAKGPAAALPWAAFAMAAPLLRKTRPPLRAGRVSAAAALALVLGLSWYAALWIFRDQSPFGSAGASADLEATFTSETAHANPWFYYFYTLPKVLLPTGIFLPFAVGWAAKRLRTQPGLVFPFCWLAAGFALLSVIPSKQEHYALQLLVPSLLLCAAAGRGLFPTASARLPAILAAGVAGIAVAILAGVPIHRFQAVPRFLRDARPVTDAAPAVHTCGVNLAIFDFLIGPHIHSVVEPGQAWRQARPGDAIVLIAPRSQADTWAPPPATPLQEIKTRRMHAELHVKP